MRSNHKQRLFLKLLLMTMSLSLPTVGWGDEIVLLKKGQTAPHEGALVPALELRRLVGDSIERDKLFIEMRDNSIQCQDSLKDQNVWGAIVYGSIGLLVGAVAGRMIR